MLPETGGSEPNEDSGEAVASAWASFHEARGKRRAMHEAVRSLVRHVRVSDEFDLRIRESMEPKEEQ